MRFFVFLSILTGLCVSTYALDSLAAMPATQNNVSPSEIRKPTAGEAKTSMESGAAVVLDVREPEELKDGVVKGAINMPMSKIDGDDPQFKGLLAQLPKNKEVWLYCRSGRRSGLVAEKLAKQGYKVRNIGGFEDLKATGLPTEKR